jgi:hypothetical protein
MTHHLGSIMSDLARIIEHIIKRRMALGGIKARRDRSYHLPHQLQPTQHMRRHAPGTVRLACRYSTSGFWRILGNSAPMYLVK